MTSVIRVKRRIDEDPAEALLVSCKRQRETADLSVASVLSFAGTLNSKSEPVSKHIKEAIQKRKVHREIHPESADYKHKIHTTNFTSKIRKQTEQASRANRYRVTWSRRALNVDLFDKEDDLNDLTPSPDSGLPEDKSDGTTEHSTTPSPEHLSHHVEADEGINSASRDNTQNTSAPKNEEKKKTINKIKRHSQEEDDVTPNVGRGSDSEALLKEKKMFCIFDVENEAEEDPFPGFNQQSSSGITVNDVPMVSRRPTSPPVDESQFVYDLYYTHNNLADLDPDAVLTVEALCDEFICDEQNGEQNRDCVYDDTDDSNDENNWRNDYPDEDPRFIENEDAEYDYAEDMVDTNFLQDDDGDLLAYWMDTRCRVDGDSDNDEDEYENDESREQSGDENNEQ